jgi:hypothetical protein
LYRYVEANVEKGGGADFKIGFVAFSVAGVVTSKVTTLPLKGAEVKLFQKGVEAPLQELVTDDAGNYSLGKLPPGAYELLVDGSDEGDGDGVPRTYNEKRVTLTVVDADIAADVGLALDLCIISGKITASVPAGAVVAGAALTLREVGGSCMTCISFDL